MNVTPELLGSICAVLGNGNAARPGIDQELRDTYPGIPFTLFDDNDVPSRLKPLAQGDGFVLYGVSTSDHCAQLTSDIESSNGLAIALTDDD